MKRILKYTIACALLLTVANRVAKADEPTATGSATKITLHPAAEPEPALKYRLLPDRLQQNRGNAAVHYGKVTAEEITFFSDNALRKNIVAWHSAPLADLRGGKVRLPSNGSIEDSIRRGALCMECDWQLPVGDVPFYTMLLPEVQQTREFGRILAARTRIQMADGKFDEAITSLQTGYALGRHVATAETLVNCLVGNVICELMSFQTIEMVQQPDSPNLYWALTMLPAPMIDLRRALDVESMGVELTFPELKDVRTARRTEQEWREIFHQFAKQVVVWNHAGDEKPELPSEQELDEACKALARTAKGILIQGGMPADDVQKMSVHQLALVQTLRVHHQLLDDGIKCYSLPHPQAMAGIDAAIERANEAHRDGREIIKLSSNTLAAIRSARSAITRIDRQIAVLRVLEALRLHAASNNGKLPQQLSDITEVPIPVDPVTDAPFIYLREAEKAFLEGPVLREVPLNYEITMLPSK